MTVEITSLTVNLNGRNILSDVSAVFSNGLHYLIGLNGSGKTTLLKCIAGLLPFKGKAQLDNQMDLPIHPGKLASLISVVPQKLNIPFRLKVYDFILMGRFPYLNWLGNYTAKDHKLVHKQIDLLGLSEFTNRHMDEISGGEMQKVLIARTLCQQTPVILLDEPAQSLDPKNKSFLYELLESLAAQGKTLICATHDLAPLSNPDSMVYGLRNGKLVFKSRGGDIQESLFAKVY